MAAGACSARRRPRGPALASAAALGLALGLAPAAARAQAPADLAELLDGLRAPELATRQRALARLAALGPSARPLIARALADADPELRFHALLLLNQAAGAIERQLRVVVEGRPTNAPTYPAALEAHRAVQEGASAETPALLIQLVRRKAAASGNEEGYVAVGLDLLRALTERAAARDALTAVDVDRLATLLEVELRASFADLVPIFLAVPRDLATPSLRAVAVGGSGPRVRARALTVLAEIAGPQGAAVTLTWLLPNLKDPSPIVRRGALWALDQLALGEDAALTPIVSLAADVDLDVAEDAVRMIGERRLRLGHEVCARLALDPDKPMRLRLEAARTLGLLGAGEGAPALLALARQAGLERSLRVTAAWALGALRAPGAREVLEGLIADPELVHEPTLYYGLARLGDVAALQALTRPPQLMPRLTDEVDRLRARIQLAIRALGATDGRAAVEALAEVVAESVVPNERWSGRTEREVLEALAALGARRDPPAAAALGRALFETSRAPPLKELLPLLAASGLGDAPDELRARVVDRLSQLVEGGASDQRARAADALVRIAPERAAPLLRRLLTQRDAGLNRDFACSLARAGDRSAVERWAMPAFVQAFEGAEPRERAVQLNGVGIGHLYGGRFDEAILTFRRMLWCRPVDDTAAYNVACGYALEGDVERGLHYLRRAVQHGFRKFRHIETDADLEVLWGEVRFERLVRRLRLAHETAMPLPDILPPAWLPQRR